jgi:hypothetical protein
MRLAAKSLIAALLVVTSCGPAFAGRRGGPADTQTSVDAYSSDRYTITFRGGETAMIVVEGDGDTDLDLYVYDENGHLVDCDTDATDFCVAVWNPRWTGVFHVVIRNLGSVYNVYYLETN